MLINLISNAIKFSNQKQEIKIISKFNKEGNKIEISIFDDGSGISQLEQKQIFTPFFRTSNI